MKPGEKKPTRRNFLIAATLGTATAAAAIVTGETSADVEKKVAGLAAGQTETTGYRVTPHIAQYYETTKL